MISSGIPQDWTKKRFSELTGDESFIKTIEDLKSWDYKDPVSVSILSKSNGCGKTHIAVCLYRKYLFERISELLKSGLDTNEVSGYDWKLFTKERHIYSEVQRTYDGGRYSESEIIERYCRKPFLVIDDLFSNRANEFSRRVMLDIIDERIDWRKLPTVITSNYNLKELSEIDSRISSRLRSKYKIELINQKDFRN